MQQYLLGETTLSEAQLRNKAIENNMSLEDLLEMNPDIKLQEDLSNNIFTLGNVELSYDQLNKKAKDNNMTLQQLLDINPDIKKSESDILKVTKEDINYETGEEYTFSEKFSNIFEPVIPGFKNLGNQFAQTGIIALDKMFKTAIPKDGA